MTMPGDGSVLVVNAGSSSLKVRVLPQGLSLLVERIGGATTVQANFEPVGVALTTEPLEHHDAALRLCLQALASRLPLAALQAVGHRVVHGGERYVTPTRIDADVLRAIEELAELAPLHNPANLRGIRAALAQLPDIPQVAVFDTAFHGSLPPRAYLYGLPRDCYRELGVRKYGFHGTSHDYVTRRAAELLGRPRQQLRLLSLHLGNGASAAAVAGGRSIDTSMGFTPLDGLLMGTRCGQLDPGVMLYLLRRGYDVERLDALLNREGGLKGLSGVSNDMRDVRRAAAAGNEAAREALAVFSYRIRTTIGSYAAAMGGLDAVIFTGGIGENDPATRAEAVAGLEFLGIALDPERNAAHGPHIERSDSRVALLVIATDEEQMIADATRALLAGRKENA